MKVEKPPKFSLHHLHPNETPTFHVENDNAEMQHLQGNVLFSVFTYSGSFLFLPPSLWGGVHCGFKGKLLADLRFPPAAQASHFHPLI